MTHTPEPPRDDPTEPHSLDAGSGAGRSAVEPPAGGAGWRKLALVGGAVVVILLVLIVLF